MGGRPAGLSREALATAKNAKILYDSGEKAVKEIAESLKISRATCYRYIDIAREMEKSKSKNDTISNQVKSLSTK